MKKIIYYSLLLAGFITSPISADYSDGMYCDHNFCDQSYCDENICCDDSTQVFYEIGTGYSRSKIDLSFFSNGEAGVAPGVTLLNKNVHTKWKDLDTFVVDGRFRVKSKYVYLRSMASWGRIGGGTNHLNYMQAFRGIPIPPATLSQSLTAKKRTQGHIYDFSGGIGYPFEFCCDRIMFAPLVGYSYTQLRLHDDVKGGRVNQTLTTPATTLLLISDITGGSNKSKYRWYGPWVGADLEFQYNSCLRVLAGYDFHWGKVHGKDSGSINLHQINSATPASAVNNTISQTTRLNAKRAHAHNVTLDFNYRFDSGCLNNWSFGISGLYNTLRTTKGSVPETAERVQTSPLPAPAPLTINEKVKLRKLTIDTYGVSFNIGYEF